MHGTHRPKISSKEEYDDHNRGDKVLEEECWQKEQEERACLEKDMEEANCRVGADGHKGTRN